MLSASSSQPGRAWLDGSPLFVYGTLQVPDVLRILLGRVPELRAATAYGWQVLALPDAVYPGMVSATTAAPVSGCLIADLKPAEWEIIDAFEDVEYDLRGVVLADGSTALSYIWRDATAERPWSLETFRAVDLLEYLRRCRRWRVQYRRNEEGFP